MHLRLAMSTWSKLNKPFAQIPLAPDREARSAASAYGAIDGLHGDAGEKRESEEVEEAARVAPEMEDPSIRHFNQPVGFLDEKKEITFSQMSVKADVYGQCIDLEQSEIKKEQMEQEDGVNGGTHPPPTISNPDLGKSLRGSMSTKNPLKNKRMIAANLRSNCFQGDSEVQLSDEAIERIKKMRRGFQIKIIEEEFRPLEVTKVWKWMNFQFEIPFARAAETLKLLRKCT